MKPIPLPIVELKNALVGLGKVINKRTTLPLLATVKIERTSEGWIALTATDLDHYATVRMEQPTDGEPASVLIPFEELVKTAKSCGKNDTLAVRAETNASVVSGFISYPVGGQMVEHRCTSYDAEEFPAIPRIKGDSIPLSPALRSSIHDAFECASSDETRYVLNGAYLDVSKPEGHYVVATDGRQLFSSNSFKLDLPESLVIPSHKFIGWREFNNDGDWVMKVGKPEKKDDPTPLQLTSRRWRFITRAVEGNYPNWRQVVPDKSKCTTTIEFDSASVDQLIQTIERMPCHDEANHTIALEVKGTTLAILGRSPSAEQWTKVEVKQAKTSGKDVLIALNREFLAKAIRFGLLKIEIIDAMSPLRMSHEGRQMIVMPIRSDCGPKHQTVAATPKPASQDAQPAAPEAAQPSSTMSETTTTSTTSNAEVPPPPEKSPLELALESIETIKGNYREAVKGLNGLTDVLKQVQREQKASDKEVQSVRATLGRLQMVKL